MNNLLKIKTFIEGWNQIRNTDVALNFLTSGSSLIISHDEYLLWEKINPDSINCYFGVDQFELKFYLIDNKSDENKNYRIGENLFEKEFSRTLLLPKKYHQTESFTPAVLSTSDSLNANKAKNRIVSWILSAEAWFEDQKTKFATSKGIVRVISIPFDDLKALFKSSSKDICCIFSMKNFSDENEESNYNIELILTRTDVTLSNPLAVTLENDTLEDPAFEDVSRPCPPFGGNLEEFTLLT
ncbi:MAG: hypothetical protein JXQ93_04410 [Flavobacteriaceae bacterium]